MFLDIFFCFSFAYFDVSTFACSLFFISISNLFSLMEVTSMYLCLFLRFVGRSSDHVSSNFLSVIGWLGSSSLLLCKDCFSLFPNACVKILFFVFDIFRSFFEYDLTDCLCEPRLLKYVFWKYLAFVKVFLFGKTVRHDS